MNNAEYVMEMLCAHYVYYKSLEFSMETEESILFTGVDAWGFAVKVKVVKDAPDRQDWHFLEQDENDPPEAWRNLGTLLP